MWLGLFLGLIFGVGVMWIVKKGLVIKWYDLVLGVLAFLSLYGGITHYIGSMHEFEPTAALNGLYIFLGIGIVLLAVSVQFIWRRNRKSSQA